MASSPEAPHPAEVKCPSCGATSPAGGRFCSNCGSPFAGATCSGCNAPLTPGARFCHRCGTPAVADGRTTEGAARATGRAENGLSSALPWGVAAIALVALVALLAGQHFARVPEPASQAAAPSVGAPGQPPDLSNMSPGDAAARLYDRVMGAHERGQADTVQLFAPMAMAAYEMIGTLDLDQRYDLGRIAAVAGDETRARAQADTILAASPNHLLGLILAGNAARMRKDQAAERAYYDKLAAAAPAERAKQLPEYSAHQNDISIALAARRP